MANNTIRRLVVVGATGKQGGGLIAALLERSYQPFEIYAVTRDPTSKGAQSLAKKGVKLIKGDFDSAESIFAQVDKPIWGLFSVTWPLGGHKVEEKNGKAMTAAAIKAGVQHIVFTATERGGQEKSETNPTPVPHFYSKYNIEKDIEVKAKASSQGTTWTFLRPVAFFENMSNDFLGKGFVAMWRLNGLDNKLQLISGRDVGKVAAEAFINSQDAEYRNKGISLAGDDLSPAQAAKIFKEVTGKDLPSTFGIVGSGLKFMMHEMLGIMFNWFKTDGFGTDMAVMKKRYPFLKDYRSWLETESAWAIRK